MLSSSGAALAQPPSTPPAPPLELRWTSTDPSCTGGDVVANTLQLVAPGVSPRPLWAAADVKRQGAAWVVELETRSANQSGRRVLRGGTCREIQQAIALLLAMVIEHEAAETPAPDTRDAPPQPPPAPTPPTSSPPLPVTPPRSTPASGPPSTTAEPSPVAAAAPQAARDPADLLLRLGGLGALGLQPGFALGVGGEVGVRWRSFEASFGATHSPATSEPISMGNGRLDVDRTSFLVSFCWVLLESAALGLAPCVAPELTLFRMRASGVLPPELPPRPPRLATLTLGVDGRLTPFGRTLFLFLTPQLVWEKPVPYTIGASPPDGNSPPTSEQRTEYQTPGLGFRLRAGFGARF